MGLDERDGLRRLVEEEGDEGFRQYLIDHTSEELEAHKRVNALLNRPGHER